MSTRAFWPMRDLPVVLWLLAAVASTLVHPWIPTPRWLMIHLLVLGAIGHAILVWSRYFADALLHAPPTRRRPQTVRLALFNAGTAAVVVGVPADVLALTVVGATALVAAVAWHAVVLARQLAGSLASRFAPTVRYYLAAAALLPFGATAGAVLARGLGDPWHDRVRAAHVALNILGWIGLTVLGTLVTLWPTMLRTRIAEGAERAAVRALPVLVAGVALTTGAALVAPRATVAIGLACYLVGIGVLVVPAARAAVSKPPETFPAWSVLCGVAWLVGCLVLLIVTLPATRSWTSFDQRLGAVTPLLAVGFAAQVLLGALSYLVPVVLGGGPTPVRAANRVFDAGGPLRLVVTNVGLLVCALPVPSLVRVLVSMAVLAALASFLPLLFLAMRASRRAKAGSPAPPASRPAGQRAGLAATGLAVVVVGVVGGAALDPASLDREVASAAAGVIATGETTHVEVVAEGMRFTPDVIEVPAGNRLVVEVHNASDGDIHDLVFETGAETGRIRPGESASVDVGVVGRGLDGWCSVVGHRQMGMVLRVEVTGSGGSVQAASDDADHGSHGSGEPQADAVLDPAATPGPGFRARDARLPAVGAGRVHRFTFEVTEEEHEVAPGVRQTLWTYAGTAPGPVLHGRVGDTFVVTLVNRGTMGHSVDFHAGSLAPDGPMRTIAPGESLVYRFTATRAGIWMYHCSTMPMSVHIASGLFGAVVIEPPDLPPVDRAYVLVQSELYFGPEGGTTDVDKVLGEQPDAVVFNGYAGQYAAQPLPARVGERVRFWLLDAGPNRASTFHVVGGQFDRVWSEGDWRLGSAAAPARRTGAQVLALGPAEGGFVELTFPEPGHYPFVSHVMIDAERGARGIVEVSPAAR